MQGKGISNSESQPVSFFVMLLPLSIPNVTKEGWGNFSLFPREDDHLVNPGQASPPFSSSHSLPRVSQAKDELCSVICLKKFL